CFFRQCFSRQPFSYWASLPSYSKSSQSPEIVFIASGQNQRVVAFRDVCRSRNAQSRREFAMPIDRAITRSPGRGRRDSEELRTGRVRPTFRRSAQHATSGLAMILMRVKDSSVVFLVISRSPL